MLQLVLPIDEFLAHDMELAIVPKDPSWLRWNAAKGGSFIRYLQEFMGDWEYPKYHMFFDFDELHLLACYDPELFLRAHANQPWLQLFLPYNVRNWRYRHADADAVADFESRIDRMRERSGLPPRLRERVRPPYRELLVGSARLPDPTDRSIYRLL